VIDARTLTENVKRANLLIAALQFIAANASLFPDGYALWGYEIEVWFYGEDSKHAIAQAMRAIRRHYNVPEIDKNYQESTFKVDILIPGTPLYFSLKTPRSNVCVKVETGETVTVKVRDYSNAPLVEKEQAVIEWICDPVLDTE
jgi:hypothetical protein